MRRRDDRKLVVGLDIGTSKVSAIVGEISAEDRLEVIGIGSNPSRGLKRGVVVNIESTVQSIQRAIEEAELMADCEINTVLTGIAGSHVRSLNSHGIVAIRDKEVSAGDVERVIDAARAVAIPADQRVIHVLPQEFIVDSQEGIREPIGMSGVRLEGKVHLVTGAVPCAHLRPFWVTSPSLIPYLFSRESCNTGKDWVTSTPTSPHAPNVGGRTQE